MNFMKMIWKKLKFNKVGKISVGGFLALFCVNQREFSNVRF